MQLDFKLAWRRIRKSGRYQEGFAENPFLDRLINHDSRAWLAEIETLVTQGTYHPSPMTLCDVPKPGFTIRPGSVLTINDLIVYTALVGNLLQQIGPALEWSQNTYDFGHVLSCGIDAKYWMSFEFEGWKSFRERSLELIKNGAQYVLFTDISAFYENIDQAMLNSDLRALSCDTGALNLLSKCLNRWCVVTGRGLPQGSQASHILAKVYLNSFDEAFATLGFTHLRYVDDIRVFCKTSTEAKQAIIKMSELLRRRGLSINSSKSTILPANEAIADIDKAQHLIEPIESLQQDILDLEADPYYQSVFIEQAQLEKEESFLSKVKILYQSHFVNEDFAFDKTIFNYCLARFRKQNDDFALASTTKYLYQQPHVTKNILKYVEALQGWTRVEEKWCEFLMSEFAIYDYQHYQIVTALALAVNAPGAEYTKWVQTMAFVASRPPYLKMACYNYLRRFGTLTDLDLIRAEYSKTTNPLEQASIVCCLQRIEVGSRNSFLARAATDGALQARAVSIVKAGGI